VATNEEVLAAVRRVEGKVDDIGSRLSAVEAWKEQAASMVDRHLDKTDEIETRLRSVERLHDVERRTGEQDHRLNNHSDRLRSLELTRARLMAYAAAAGLGGGAVLEIGIFIANKVLGS